MKNSSRVVWGVQDAINYVLFPFDKFSYGFQPVYSAGIGGNVRETLVIVIC